VHRGYRTLNAPMHLYGPLPIASAPTGPSGALSRKRSRESGYRIGFRDGSALLPPGARLQPLLYTGQPGSGPTVRVHPKIPPPAGTLTITRISELIALGDMQIRVGGSTIGTPRRSSNLQRPGQGEVVERGELPLNGTGSFVTRRWRKPDSNHRFRCVRRS
jgi:hypothetical protein